MFKHGLPPVLSPAAVSIGRAELEQAHAGIPLRAGSRAAGLYGPPFIPIKTTVKR